MDLIAFATGGRPYTSRTMQRALKLALQDEKEVEVIGVTWHSDTVVADPFAELELPECGPGTAYNAALERFIETHGDLPEHLFTMDDDAVIGQETLPRLRAILEADESIGLLGAWNDLSERNRGQSAPVLHRLGEDVVQFDPVACPSFCVGGALHAIPRRALELMREESVPEAALMRKGGVYLEIARREDEALTNRIRSLGMRACIALTVPVALLPDDHVHDWYRGFVASQTYSAVRDATQL